jgi:hypothetical protein
MVNCNKIFVSSRFMVWYPYMNSILDPVAILCFFSFALPCIRPYVYVVDDRPTFIACTPVLEVILFERIKKLRPKSFENENSHEIAMGESRTPKRN